MYMLIRNGNDLINRAPSGGRGGGGRSTVCKIYRHTNEYSYQWLIQEYGYKEMMGVIVQIPRITAQGIAFGYTTQSVISRRGCDRGRIRRQGS